MSTERRTTQSILSRRPMSYEVGFGKPPASGRFQPGQSGNPKGRPRGSKNRKSVLPALNAECLNEIILKEAYRAVQVNEPSGQLTIPMAQAVLRSLAVNAAKGGQRAQYLFTRLVSSAERQSKEQRDSLFNSALTYKFEWERELERRARLGIKGPEPLPHPNHVHVDMRRGTVAIRGPVTKEEKAEWDRLVAQKKEFQDDIVTFEGMLRKARGSKRINIRRSIDETRRTIEFLEKNGF